MPSHGAYPGDTNVHVWDSSALGSVAPGVRQTRPDGRRQHRKVLLCRGIDTAKGARRLVEGMESNRKRTRHGGGLWRDQMGEIKRGECAPHLYRHFVRFDGRTVWVDNCKFSNVAIPVCDAWVPAFFHAPLLA